MIFSKKIKLFTVFILVKIFFTAFSLFIFHNFSPLIDAHLYQSEYYDIATKDLSIKISLRTYSEIKGHSVVNLFTHLQVKEDSHTLFGFYDKSERKTFLSLLSITGVGPSTAIMILSSLSSIKVV